MIAEAAKCGVLFEQEGIAKFGVQLLPHASDSDPRLRNKSRAGVETLEDHRAAPKEGAEGDEKKPLTDENADGVRHEDNKKDKDKGTSNNEGDGFHHVDDDSMHDTQHQHLADARAELHNTLHGGSPWWILEFLPFNISMFDHVSGTMKEVFT
jgi:hypothetical protein